MARYELPPEIWLEVFGNLDYRTLKTLLRVSKHFNNILRDTSKTRYTAVNRALFMDFPVELQRRSGVEDEPVRQLQLQQQQQQEQKEKQEQEQQQRQTFQLHPFLLGCGVDFVEPQPDWISLSPPRTVYVDGEAALRDDGKYDVEMLLARYCTSSQERRKAYWRDNATSPATAAFFVRYKQQLGRHREQAAVLGCTTENRGVSVLRALVLRVHALQMSAMGPNDSKEMPKDIEDVLVSTARLLVERGAIGPLADDERKGCDDAKDWKERALSAVVELEEKGKQKEGSITAKEWAEAKEALFLLLGRM